MKLRTVPNWPPQPGQAFDKTYTSPSIVEAILKEVVPSPREKRVAFKYEFAGKSFSYVLEVADASLAVGIERELRRNIGKSVMELGELEIPTDHYRRTA